MVGEEEEELGAFVVLRNGEEVRRGEMCTQVGRHVEEGVEAVQARQRRADARQLVAAVKHRLQRRRRAVADLGVRVGKLAQRSSFLFQMVKQTKSNKQTKRKKDRQSERKKIKRCNSGHTRF